MNDLNFQSNKFSTNDERLKIISSCIKEVDFHKKSVLDIGCGTGDYSNFFLNLGAKSYEGIDISKENILSAQNKFPSSLFHLGDYMDFIFTNSYDIIFSESSLHYFEKPFYKILQKIYTSLSENGKIILTHGRFSFKSLIVISLRRFGLLAFKFMGESFFLKLGKWIYRDRFDEKFLLDRLVYLKEFPRLLSKKEIEKALVDVGFAKESIQIYPIPSTSFIQADHFFVYAKKL